MKKFILILAVLAIGVTTVASAQKVRVMSYNVKNGGGMDGIKDIRRCGRLVREVQPDVVAVQEVDSVTRRNKFYVLGRMAEEAGYHAYFGPTIPHTGGKYGIGVLTKEPALSVAFHRLPCPREPRGLLVVEMDKYYILSTHLSLSEPYRVESVGIIKDVISKLKNKPIFIAGDMNAKPASKPIVAFKEFATLLTDDSKYTFPSNDPRQCIDYIFGVNGSFKVLKNYVFYDSLFSDHVPLYIDVKVGKQKKSKK